MNITISIIQFECKVDQYEINFNNIKKFIANLPQREKHLVVLPELWSSGFTDDLSFANRMNSEILTELESIALERNILIAGSYIIEENKNFYNRLLFVNSSGVIASYNKINLFPQLNEFTMFSSGNQLSILNIWGIKIGMAICYDLRFPEIFREYAARGVEICVIPAQWPEKRRDHYKTLLKARAIENQMLIASANISGQINNTRFSGNSSIIDYLGIYKAELENEELFSSIEFELDDLYSWRENFPVLNQINHNVNLEISDYIFESTT